MKSTVTRIFCGKDEDGPIILIGGTVQNYGIHKRIDFYQDSPAFPAEIGKGEIRVDQLGDIEEATKEDCAELIKRYAPGIVELASLAEVVKER